MKLIGFTTIGGLHIGIPADKITGITEATGSGGNCFIATGADTPEGGENGGYVKETYREVWTILESFKGEA